MSITTDPQMLYLMLAMPALFGLSLVGEGVYKITHYQSGWVSVLLGGIFLAVVTFGYFFLKELM